MTAFLVSQKCMEALYAPPSMRSVRRGARFCAQWREKCGPDYPLMLDCYMALDVREPRHLPGESRREKRCVAHQFWYS